MFTARKAQLEERQRKEAEMELQQVVGRAKTVSVSCPNCKYVQQFELDNRVPIVHCSNCSYRLVLQSTGQPQVVSR